MKFIAHLLTAFFLAITILMWSVNSIPDQHLAMFLTLYFLIAAKSEK